VAHGRDDKLISFLMQTHRKESDAVETSHSKGSSYGNLPVYFTADVNVMRKQMES
jgi:hypothetical protein